MKMKEVKTIIVAVPYGRMTRDLLRSRFLEILRKKVKVVILTPAFKKNYFRREFGGKNVFIEEMKPYKKRLEHLFMEFRNGLFASAKFSDTFNVKYEKFRKETVSLKLLKKSWKLFALTALRSFSYFLGKIFCKTIAARSKQLRRFFKKLDVMLFPDPFYDELFEKYKPALVFTTHVFYGGGVVGDLPVLKRAIQKNVLTISMIPSWDNLTSKGELPVEINKLIVWNNIMKQEAVELHDYAPEDIFVCGAPQFDLYFNKKILKPHNKFFKEIGADPRKKLITYIAGTEVTAPCDEEIVQILNSFIEEKKIVYPSQVLVRRYPIDQRPWEKFAGYKNIIIQYPGRESDVFPDKWDPSKRDIIHLANLLYHSDVVVNVASTITIEAAIFDTPIVNIAFDGFQEKEYLNSVRRYYDYSHYKNIVTTGGVRIARNKEDLLKFVNAYLKDPSLDRAERRKIVKEQCFFTEGRSGERIAQCLLKAVSGNANARTLRKEH